MRFHYRYTHIPAAVGDRYQNITFIQEPLGLLIGGGNDQQYLPGNKIMEEHKYKVLVVDVVKWIKDSFSLQDWVLVKVDAEGAEFPVINGLIDRGVDKYVDALAFECHGKGGDCNKLRDRLINSSIKVLPYH